MIYLNNVFIPSKHSLTNGDGNINLLCFHAQDAFTWSNISFKFDSEFADALVSNTKLTLVSHPRQVAAILVIMFVPTFKTAVIQYISA